MLYNVPIEKIASILGNSKTQISLIKYITRLSLLYILDCIYTCYLLKNLFS
jgi:hypothetical protein